MDLKQEISEIININGNNINTKPFVIYYKYLYYLEFYDNKGKFINSISHKDIMFYKCDALQFKENILILISDFRIMFLYIDSNMLEYQFSHVFLFDFNCVPGKIKDVFKINECYIGYFIKHYFYYIELGDEQKIFRKDIPLEQDANKYFYITSSRDLINQKLINIIPFFDEKNSIKLIGIVFINEIINSSNFNDFYYSEYGYNILLILGENWILQLKKKIK